MFGLSERKDRKEILKKAEEISRRDLEDALRQLKSAAPEEREALSSIVDARKAVWMKLREELNVMEQRKHDMIMMAVSNGVKFVGNAGLLLLAGNLEFVQGKLVPKFAQLSVPIRGSELKDDIKWTHF